MGEYYRWVNVDRKEYLLPSNFGYGSKREESLVRSNELLKALHTLLAAEWRGCRVFWMGDETPLPEKSDIEMFAVLEKECIANGGGKGDLFDTVCETYRNVSGQFKTADKERVRERIGFYIEDLKRGEEVPANEYGIDPLDPYAGLFRRETRDYRYIIDTTKKTAYSFDGTKILYLDGTESDFADPLPTLLGYGKYSGAGEWVGDCIEVSDELPEGITLLDSITLDW